MVKHVLTRLLSASACHKDFPIPFVVALAWGKGKVRFLMVRKNESSRYAVTSLNTVILVLSPY